MDNIVRMTKQRKVILEEIYRHNCHPTADKLYESVRKLMPNISLGTVYRNIEILFREGLILKLDSSGPQIRVDGNTDLHWHIVCKDCGDIKDICSIEESLIRDHLLKNSDFQYLKHHTEITGICPKCQNK